MSASITLTDVAIDVGADHTRVLSGINLDIQDGETLAIVGRSGVGKSTLLRSIAGVHPIAAGAITFFSNDVPVEACQHRRSLVFQGDHLMPWLRSIDNVAFSTRLRNHPRRLRRRTERRSFARTVLDDLGLAEVADAYPHELSGGQRQRVAIARAVAAEPDVILLDEPFSALDVATRANLQDWIVQHRGDLARTAVLVTHDLSEALYVADRIVLLDSSRHPGDVDGPGISVWTSDVHDRTHLPTSAVRSQIESHFSLA